MVKVAIAPLPFDPALNDGEVDEKSRRISALAWLTTGKFGSASVIFFTLLIAWTGILVIGFEFFFREVEVGHGIDAAFSSISLIIGIIYGNNYKEWRSRKREGIAQYFRARSEMKGELFAAVRADEITLDNALLYHLALYQTFNRHHIRDIYQANIASVYNGDDARVVGNLLLNRAAFLADFLAGQTRQANALLPQTHAVSVLLAQHVINAKLAVEVPEPEIYNLHTYILFFIALFVLYPFATWVALGPVLTVIAVPFVLFVLFVPSVVDRVIGDPWHPNREVDIGAHELWFSRDVLAFREYLQ